MDSLLPKPQPPEPQRSGPILALAIVFILFILLAFLAFLVAAALPTV